MTRKSDGAPATFRVSSGHLYKHVAATASSDLRPLGDVIPLRPLKTVVSVGDIVMLAGIATIVAAGMQEQGDGAIDGASDGASPEVSRRDRPVVDLREPATTGSLAPEPAASPEPTATPGSPPSTSPPRS